MQAQDVSTKRLTGHKYHSSTRSISASVRVTMEDCESGKWHKADTHSPAPLCSTRAARATGRHASPPTLSFAKRLVRLPGLRPSGKLIEENRLLFCDREALLCSTGGESQLGAQTLCSLSAVLGLEKRTSGKI